MDISPFNKVTHKPKSKQFYFIISSIPLREGGRPPKLASWCEGVIDTSCHHCSLVTDCSCWCPIAKRCDWQPLQR